MKLLCLSILGTPGSKKCQALPSWSLLDRVLPPALPKLGHTELERENEPSESVAPHPFYLEASEQRTKK